MKYLLITVLAFTFISGLCHNSLANVHTSGATAYAMDLDEDCPKCDDIEDSNRLANCCSNKSSTQRNLAYLKTDRTPQKSQSPLPYTYWGTVKENILNQSAKDKREPPTRTNPRPHNLITGFTLKLE